MEIACERLYLNKRVLMLNNEIAGGDPLDNKKQSPKDADSFS